MEKIQRVEMLLFVELQCFKLFDFFFEKYSFKYGEGLLCFKQCPPFNDDYFDDLDNGLLNNSNIIYKKSLK
jgi:hypothetical protein